VLRESVVATGQAGGPMAQKGQKHRKLGGVCAYAKEMALIGNEISPQAAQKHPRIALMLLGALLGALVNLNRSGHYIHWGFIQISVANFLVIVLMVVVFILAILLPFPRRKGGR
jgi:hypothetical protein